MTEIGEPVSARKGGPPAKVPMLRGRVVSVEFSGSAKLSENRALVTGPHWQAQGDRHARPVAYPKATKKIGVKVGIEVTSANVSGEARLQGRCADLRFEGTCAAASGTHHVEAHLEGAPEQVEWLRGEIRWSLDAPRVGHVALANGTPLELFSLWAAPRVPFPAHALGVPVEALRWVFRHGLVAGAKTEKALVSGVTRACHGRPKTRYDTRQGSPQFLGLAGSFRLFRYVSPAQAGDRVNCYDQANAVYLLGRAMGANVEILYLGYSQFTPHHNFGYIQPTHLIGVASCNNPFYESPLPLYDDGTIVLRAFPRPLAPRNWGGNVDVLKRDGVRTSFGNHAFCALATEIFDACAGPVTGLSKHDYVAAAIDRTTDYYALWSSAPGTEADIGLPAGIAAWLLPRSWE